MNPNTKETEETEAPVDKDGRVERESLAQSERQASEPHPENYKEEETDSKIVEIGDDVTQAPIEGLDPDPAPRGQP